MTDSLQQEASALLREALAADRAHTRPNTCTLVFLTCAWFSLGTLTAHISICTLVFLPVHGLA